tara:strand:+ start:1408 stop:2265 length:858 start_codon:yes stop_codon:yes gene_type:complete
LKKLYFHIGTPKTGTTSLKKVLESSSTILEKNNIKYINANSLLHSIYCELSTNNERKKYLKPYIVDEGLNEMFEKSNYDKFILVSEWLYAYCTVYDKEISSLVFLKKLKRYLSSFELIITINLRRQDRFLISLYRHKAEKKLVPDIYNFYQDNINYFNYYKTLMTIKSIFPKAKVIVHPFNKKNLIENILGSMKIDNLKLATNIDKKNISRPFGMILLMQIFYRNFPFLFRNKKANYHFRKVFRLISNIYFKIFQQTSSRFLTNKFRDEILNLYRDENAIISKNF